jgi:hypothetical protein
MREELAEKDREVQELKANLTMTLQQLHQGSSAPSHFKSLLESQSNELVRQRKVIDEYTKKER